MTEPRWDHRIPRNCPTYYNGCNCMVASVEDLLALAAGDEDLAREARNYGVEYYDHPGLRGT